MLGLHSLVDGFGNGESGSRWGCPDLTDTGLRVKKAVADPCLLFDEQSLSPRPGNPRRQSGGRHEMAPGHLHDALQSQTPLQRALADDRPANRPVVSADQRVPRRFASTRARRTFDPPNTPRSIAPSVVRASIICFSSAVLIFVAGRSLAFSRSNVDSDLKAGPRASAA